MLDDLMFSEEEVAEVQNPQQGSSQGYNEYQKNNNQNNWKGDGDGGNNWRNREEVVEEPYNPVTIFIDRDFPQEIQDKLVTIASRLINKGYVVRYNADQPELHQKLKGISDKNTEAYTPWKNFNDIESRLYWNSKTALHMASTNFPAWDKVPKAVQSMLARNVRLIFGNRNNSVTKCVITWSPDGASRAPEVTRETGRASFVISLAAKYSFPVVNIQKEGAIAALEKAFEL